MSDFQITPVTMQVPQFSFVPAQESQQAQSSASPGAVFKQLLQLVQQLMQMLTPLFDAQSGQPSSQQSGGPGGPGGSGAAPTGSGDQSSPAVSKASTAQGASAPAPAPSTAASTTDAVATSPSTSAGSNARSVQEAKANTNPQFKPVLRGDEAAKDAAIKTQADFGRAVDQTAKEYGLDPNAFRAELQAESSAFTEGFQKAMQHEGDLDRRGDNNTSIGLGQISRKFLDGREWSGDGPGNERVGSQVVSTEDYMKSPTVQMRMAAANIAQRIADKGGIEQGLAYYVSGDADPSNPKARAYIENINKAMNDPTVTDVGRG